MKLHLFSVFYRSFILLCLFLTSGACRNTEQGQTGQTTANVQQQPRHKHRHNRQPERTTDQQASLPTNAVPDYALTVLTYVRKNGQAPDGYVGGRTFGNFERLLPVQNRSGQRLRYQEWDVRPKARGQNRGAERLVTSSDDHAYYTRDHYRTFTEIQ